MFYSIELLLYLKSFNLNNLAKSSIIVCFGMKLYSPTLLVANLLFYDIMNRAYTKYLNKKMLKCFI